MHKAQFAVHLQLATSALLPFMRSLVSNPLSDTPRYLISLSEWYYTVLLQQSSCYVGDVFSTPVNGFPAQATQHGWIRSVNAQAVIELLWHDGEVPMWINIEVHSANDSYTYISLLCSDRVSTDEKQLYHREEGYPPFHGLSGLLPPNWRNVEQDGKFDLAQTRR